MSKIKLEDSFMDIMVKMGEGNHDAITCLVEMNMKKDWYAGIDGAMLVLYCDTLELYGSKLYMLWNDCCGRDLNKMELVLRNWKMGKLSKEAIHANLDKGRGTPFEGLLTLEELFDKGDDI